MFNMLGMEGGAGWLTDCFHLNHTEKQQQKTGRFPLSNLEAGKRPSNGKQRGWRGGVGRDRGVMEEIEG